MPNLVLGVSGSIAAYRAADIARELMRRGFTVRTCLTDAAERFVRPALFEALTGQPCLVDTFEEPETGRMAHIDWARQADVLLIAPASANTLVKLSQGIADDMLSTIAVAYRGPLVVAPAMNPSMYAHDATLAALDTLRRRAASIVEPVEGDVACGEHGQGKLASIEAIVTAVQIVSERSELLKGEKVLITSGPTYEPLDEVRFIGNRSSGRMGAALARAALLMGAEVTVVTGPTSTPLPLEANVVRVRTAEEMLSAAKEHVKGCFLVVGAAAVADYRPKLMQPGKPRRGDKPIAIELVPNPDIIAQLSALASPGSRVIGFAAEPEGGQDVAKQKIQKKGLYAIAVNDIIVPGIGFESEDNELTLVWPDGVATHSGRRSKLGCALWLLEQVGKKGEKDEKGRTGIG